MYQFLFYLAIGMTGIFLHAQESSVSDNPPLRPEQTISRDDWSMLCLLAKEGRNKEFFEIINDKKILLDQVYPLNISWSNCGDNYLLNIALYNADYQKSVAFIKEFLAYLKQREIETGDKYIRHRLLNLTVKTAIKQPVEPGKKPRYEPPPETLLDWAEDRLSKSDGLYIQTLLENGAKRYSELTDEQRDQIYPWPKTFRPQLRPEQLVDNDDWMMLCNAAMSGQSKDFFTRIMEKNINIEEVYLVNLAVGTQGTEYLFRHAQNEGSFKGNSFIKKFLTYLKQREVETGDKTIRFRLLNLAADTTRYPPVTLLDDVIAFESHSGGEILPVLIENSAKKYSELTDNEKSKIYPWPEPW